MPADGAVWSSRRSLRPIIPRMVIGFAAVGAVAYFAFQQKEVDTRRVMLIAAGVLGAVLLLVWFVAWVGSLGSEYRIDERTVFQRTGLLSKRTVSISIRDVRSINLNQGIGQRILGVGDVLVGTAGTEGVEVTFKDVESPQKVVDTIQRLRRDQTTVGQPG